ncbi:acyl-CoA synthetase [Amycolatopsis rhizosphaerae]|uniref:Acyl-CoA synthetase n=1 Tax=Amycolatopsis rhizosphaerae TaxID=2053003 RepID=A0A558CRG7_9PSEU|nr:acyl-CoA synthetase [Amycolatopsis rhizosphaerae]TVT51369.1 acyl-CoA synthetase [Amycolatopsis rhizosphaerae]
MLRQWGFLARRAADEAAYVALCARSGLLGLETPGRIARMAGAFGRFGTVAALPVIAGIRYAERTAVIDERGTLSFAELDARTNALANAWRERGLRPGEGVAILARNHRGFLESVFAAAKCGARIVLLNTDFAGPQIREVAVREGTELLVYDEEYAGMLAGVEPPRGRFRAWADSPGEDTLDALIAGASREAPPDPGQAPKVILLTSGTTGKPKGAPRAEPKSLAPVGALLSKVPFRTREVTECCAPMFHTLGFAHALLAVLLGSTLVIRRRFDPAVALESLHRNRATALIVVPVMLHRMLELDEEAFRGKDLSSLRIIFVAGAQLGARLCERAMARFGPVLYNLYGSTEVAYATIATPEDLADEPGCVGGVVRGARVKVLDEHGRELPPGRTGRIFVGNTLQFEGYTGGGTKEVIDGLMSSGDVGHFDAHGRLFIDGRDDEMIVSGGENVFPNEVEELLARHESIVEVSAIGVVDEIFGQRLRAFVVRREETTLSEDDVKDYVKANLARYKVPRDVVFLDRLPRNPTGKVLKRELARYEVSGDRNGS